jgi:hypothetical protein
VHVIHIFLVAWLFRGMNWSYVTTMSAYLLGAALVILTVPHYLQRPVALGFYAAAIPLSFYGFPPAPGMAWFIPFLFLKLLVSHLVREEPHRPSGASPPTSRP